MKQKPVVLMILDGYGLNDNPNANAIAMANTPVVSGLMENAPEWQSAFRTDRWATPRSAT